MCLNRVSEGCRCEHWRLLPVDVQARRRADEYINLERYSVQQLFAGARGRQSASARGRYRQAAFYLSPRHWREPHNLDVVGHDLKTLKGPGAIGRVLEGDCCRNRTERRGHLDTAALMISSDFAGLRLLSRSINRVLARPHELPSPRQMPQRSTVPPLQQTPCASSSEEQQRPYTSTLLPVPPHRPHASTWRANQHVHSSSVVGREARWPRALTRSALQHSPSLSTTWSIMQHFPRLLRIPLSQQRLETSSTRLGHLSTTLLSS